MIGKLYALLNAVPSCFSEKKFQRDFCNMRKFEDPSATHLICAVQAASGIDGCYGMLTMSRSLCYINNPLLREIKGIFSRGHASSHSTYIDSLVLSFTINNISG